MSRKLAYICGDPGIPPDGTKGASIHFREFGLALARAGWTVDACTARAARTGTFQTRSFGCPASPTELGRELVQLIDQRAATTVIQAGGKHDAVYERYSLFGLAGLAYAQEQGIPLIVEVNAPLWEEAARYRNLQLQHVARGLARDLFAHADRVLAVSSVLAEQLEAFGVDPDRLQVFPNGVARDRFLSPAKIARPASLQAKTCVVFVGSLKPWHGVEFLLENFARLPKDSDLGLWIVGDGPLASTVERAVARFPDRVAWTGQLPHEDIPGVLASADMAVAPYTEHSPTYFCPLKVVEAMAAGCPVLASRTAATDSFSDWIHRFDAGDGDGFLSLATRLAADETKRRELGEAAREYALRCHTWDERARELDDIVDEARAAVA